MNNNSRKLIPELILVTVSLLAVAKLLHLLRGISWLSGYIASIVAVLFLYVPFLVLWKRGRPVDFVERDWPAIRKSILTYLTAAAIIFPVFLVLAHFWQIVVLKKHFLGFSYLPRPLHLIVYQLIIIALPEEFFFRGYFQSTIDLVFTERKRILGVEMGWGMLITALVFAVAHSVITYQWWHFSIFFPALVFGYLRLRTGSLIAPILFHATANIVMNWFSRMYA